MAYVSEGRFPFLYLRFCKAINRTVTAVCSVVNVLWFVVNLLWCVVSSTYEWRYSLVARRLSNFVVYVVNEIMMPQLGITSCNGHYVWAKDVVHFNRDFPHQFHLSSRKWTLDIHIRIHEIRCTSISNSIHTACFHQYGSKLYLYVCVHIYKYIYIYIYTHIYMCIYTHTHTCRKCLPQMYI